jgi:hypothetical protein
LEQNEPPLPRANFEISGLDEEVSDSELRYSVTLIETEVFLVLTDCKALQKHSCLQGRGSTGLIKPPRKRVHAPGVSSTIEVKTQ